MNNMSDTFEQNNQTQKKLEDRFWWAIETSSRESGFIESAWYAVQHFERQAHAHNDISYQNLDVNARSIRKGSWFGCTPLCIAVARAFPNVVRFLIDTCGADVNVTSNDMFFDTPVLNRPPLHFAARTAGNAKLSLDVMLMLLHYGADTSATDAAGKTALHLVCFGRPHRNSSRTLDALNALLDYATTKSSLVSRNDYSGKSGFDYAWSAFGPSWYDTHILNVLIENGANVHSDEGRLHLAVSNMQDKHGRCRFYEDTKTPRWYMAIKILLMAGADPFNLYEGISATTVASYLKKNSHPACDNIIAIFVAIQNATDTLRTEGADRDIRRSEMEAIIETAESKKLCNTWGRRFEDWELVELKMTHF
jgi:Ankyrin repeat